MKKPSTIPPTVEAFAPPRGWAVLPAVVVCDPTLTPEARCVLFGIAAHYSDDGGAWPSLARLGSYLGRSRSTVLRALGDLERAQLIRREHRFSRGQQQTTRYVLCFDRWGGVTSETGQARGGVTGDAPSRVTGEAPSRVTGEAQTGPENNTTEHNHPLSPATGGGTVAGAEWAETQARTRTERAQLAKLLERGLGACTVCGDQLRPMIVEHRSGARTVNVRQLGRLTPTGAIRYRHLWCDGQPSGENQDLDDSGDAAWRAARATFLHDLSASDRDAFDEWEKTGAKPAVLRGRPCVSWTFYLSKIAEKQA